MWILINAVWNVFIGNCQGAQKIFVIIYSWKGSRQHHYYQQKLCLFTIDVNKLIFQLSIVILHRSLFFPQHGNLHTVILTWTTRQQHFSRVFDAALFQHQSTWVIHQISTESLTFWKEIFSPSRRWT